MDRRFLRPLLTLVACALAAGCNYEGSVSVIECDAAEECPDGFDCLEGVCALAAEAGDNDGDGDGELNCPGSLSACDGECVDTTADANHCGGCGLICDAGSVCDEGTCETECSGTLEVCENACVDPMTNASHCGTCGHPCLADGENTVGVCDGGECAVQCAPGFESCTEGCVDLLTDADNCGVCGLSCATGSCSDGVCEPYYCDPSIDDGFGGGTGEENDPYTICTTTQLLHLNTVGNQHFVLSADIDFGGAIIDPIESPTGKIDGMGYAITNFGVISDDANSGLFRGLREGGEIRNLLIGGAEIGATGDAGVLAGGNWGTIENVRVFDSYIAGASRVGGLVGQNHATIRDSSSSATVFGAAEVGGLVGRNHFNGVIENSSSSGVVSATGNSTGGLVGLNREFIRDSHASGAVFSSGNGVGGLVGFNEGDDDNACLIERSSASGSVYSEGEYVGGLVGFHRYSECKIEGSFATGNVTSAHREVGGLVGRVRDNSSVFDSYATGRVAGPERVGGFVGRISESSHIENSYSTGFVTGGSDTGGFVGANSATITSCYWNTETSGRIDNNGGTGKNSAEFAEEITFEGWDFGSTWIMSPELGRPILIWQTL